MTALQGLGLFGTGLSATSQLSAGNQANSIGKIQQGQLNQNADLLDYSAEGAQAQGINQAAADIRKNKFTQSRIVALNAAAGGDSTDKNVAELLANTSAEGEYNALNSIYEGSNRATQLKNEAISQKNQGTVARYMGKQSQIASRTQAISTLIGGGAKSFSSSYGNNKFSSE